MLYRYIDEVKALGAEIQYNRISKTFYYISDLDIKVDINFDNY